MATIDQAFWQLYHAVAAKVAGSDGLDGLLKPAPDGAMALDFEAPVHAMGVLRREAERRKVDYPTLIADLSEERRAELPEWWLVIAGTRGIGVLPSGG